MSIKKEYEAFSPLASVTRVSYFYAIQNNFSKCLYMKSQRVLPVLDRYRKKKEERKKSRHSIMNGHASCLSCSYLKRHHFTWTLRGHQSVFPALLRRKGLKCSRLSLCINIHITRLPWSYQIQNSIIKHLYMNRQCVFPVPVH